LIVLLYAFFGTELGCSIRATGSNAVMSRAQGINTGFTKILGLAISNALVALSGALLCQYQGFADINMGRGAVVIGLAAVVIGEALVSRLPQNFALSLFGVLLGADDHFRRLRHRFSQNVLGGRRRTLPRRPVSEKADLGDVPLKERR